MEAMDRFAECDEPEFGETLAAIEERADDFALHEQWESAVTFYRRAALHGSPSAQYELACCYEEGLGVEKNISLAKTWYRKAAAAGNCDAQFYLGWMYNSGTHVARNDELAVAWYLRAARAGHPTAQWNLSLCYEEGTGIPVDDRKSIEWCRKAADQGQPDAQYSLGWRYFCARGIDHDLSAAKKWLAKSAEANHDQAQFCIAILSDTPEEAARWFIKAADNGHHGAQVRAGLAFLHGSGVEADVDRAIGYFSQAAEQGNVAANFYLGISYKSQGDSENLRRAASAFQVAADHNDIDSQRHLGALYAEGSGVPRDVVLSYKWFNIAAGQGDDLAARARDALEEVMLRTQVAEAQRLSRNFRPVS
jgi:TPR repeat protein